MTILTHDDPVTQQVRALTVPQQLACALRILSKVGYNENFAGHITWQEPGDDHTMWCNPATRWWQEVQASDICRVDFDGTVVDGRWPVTDAIFIHTELHRVRPDARVVIHGHPYYATLLAALPMAPYITHQAGCVLDDEIRVVNEFDGGVLDQTAGAHLAGLVGDASGVVLANHGALVCGADMAIAAFRADTFERMCRTTWDLVSAGRTAQPIADDIRPTLKDWLLRNGAVDYWNGAVRQLIRTEPEVLD
ncbi:MAG TPA: class II aldolase/adducin family protein [Acidimicrobiales bacterium]|jgi:ribulose-5-phosphate 4-epimerase/fuculose-1-phosphate aldolase|nr:class II aldolase/adducin family protein [Acidimicrobiales bacterium]